MQHRISEFSSNEALLGDALMARYQYTKEGYRQREKNRFQLAFTNLFYFDLVRLIRPQASGRVGHIMHAQIRDFVAPIVGPNSAVQPDVAAKEINKWSLIGAKLNVLCAEFGPGCLFFLGDMLSPDL
jgi:hypothetical protein